MDNGGFNKMYSPIKFAAPGTLHNLYLHRHKAFPSPRLHSKPFHYPPDGSGRDKYVKINEGGLSCGTGKRKHYVQSFKDSLRMNERNVNYLERRNYISDTQKMTSRRFSDQDLEMKATPKRLRPLEGIGSPLSADRRAQSYLSNGPNVLDPVVGLPMNNTANNFNIVHTPKASKVLKDYV